MKKKVIVLIVISISTLIILAGISFFMENKKSSANEDFLGSTLLAEGFVSPIDILESPDNSGRLFVVDRIGEIKIIKNGEVLDEPFLDIKDRIVSLKENYDERGLLGMTFSPDYEESGRFFVYYSGELSLSAEENWDHTGYLSEFRVSNDINKADINSEQIILSIDQPQLNHNGGQISFGEDGFLYVALGDGGAANDVGIGHPEIGNGQNTSTLLGSILRLDVSNSGKYEIPVDNPFVGIEGRDEIYAYGFRNPFKFSFDNNVLYVSDVGQNLLEEVNIVVSGENYGWNIMEGNNCFNKESPDLELLECNKTNLVNPIFEYPHSGENISGKAIIGGYIYRGKKIPELQGKYIFADWSSDFLRPKAKLFLASEENEVWSIIGYRELDVFILSLGRDNDGEIYFLTSDVSGPFQNTGKVYEMSSNPF